MAPRAHAPACPARGRISALHGRVSVPRPAPAKIPGHNRPSWRAHIAPLRNSKPQKLSVVESPRPSLGLEHVRVSGLRPAVLDTPKATNGPSWRGRDRKAEVVVGLGLISKKGNSVAFLVPFLYLFCRPPYNCLNICIRITTGVTLFC